MKLIKSTAIIGSMTLLSRILGLVRDILWARFLGAGVINDALLTAIKLPNLFRRMFAEGAFNSAFVPMYARRLEGEGEDAAANFAGEALAALTLLVAVIVVAFQLTMPWSLNLIGGGLSRTEVPGLEGVIPYNLAVFYARITMPYLIFMSLAALLSGMLNTRNKFAVAAFVPAMLNVLWLAVLGSQAFTSTPAETLGLYMACGMTISGLLQVGLLIIALKRAAIRLPIKWPRFTPGVKRLLILGLPGVIAAGITHINLMISHLIATQQVGAPSWLYYSDRLYQLPLGLIGIAMGVALLPTLSRSLRAGDEDGAMVTLNRAAEISAFLTLPAAVALFVMPNYLITTLFERGLFTSTDSLQTARALRMFALGLPAFVLIKVLTPTFFAREDTRTPMIFAGISAVVNLALGATLFFTVGFYGLALATSVAAWGNVLCLAIAQRFRGHFTLDARLKRKLPRIIIAAAVMGGALFYIVPVARPMMRQQVLWDYGLMLCVAGAGFAIYIAAAFAIRAFSMRDIKEAFKK
ncbi:MAG: murein biosynthesis integral membrane protein MurJ [Maricaulaceae bacterium]